MRQVHGLQRARMRRPRPMRRVPGYRWRGERTSRRHARWFSERGLPCMHGVQVTREEAIRVLLDVVDRQEPVTQCAECMGTLFPRLTADMVTGESWRPGLRWAPEHEAWWRSMLLWERSDRKSGRPILPKTAMYIRCDTCGGTGVVGPGRGPIHDAVSILAGDK